MTSREALSPSPDTSSDDAPLAFDSERELVDLLTRVRSDLQRRARNKWAQLPLKDQSQEKLVKLEKIVLEDFYDHVAPIVCSNCTIAGLTYPKHKEREDVGETAPFSEDLHLRVRRYQDELFVARTENVKQRREIPLRMQENVKKLVGHDLNRLRVLEGGDGEGFEFAEEEVKEDVDDDKKFGPGKKEAAELFGQARKDLEKLLVDIPKLTHEADNATRLVFDTSRLS